MEDTGDAEGQTPVLTLEGFSGSLERLLTLARARQIDLAHIPVGELVDQLLAALQQAPAATPLGQKGDWVVMAAWLVQLRSRLLLPTDTPAQQAADQEAAALRDRLAELQVVQTLAAWLDRQPQLGRDVFVCGYPEPFAAEPAPQADVIEFLWASLALFDDDRIVGGSDVYRPRWLDLHSVADARVRIMRRLAEKPEGDTLEALLPDSAATETNPLRRRSARASAFVASLELVKQGDAIVTQDGTFTPIHIRSAYRQ